MRMEIVDLCTAVRLQVSILAVNLLAGEVSPFLKVGDC